MRRARRGGRDPYGTVPTSTFGTRRRCPTLIVSVVSWLSCCRTSGEVRKRRASPVSHMSVHRRCDAKARATTRSSTLSCEANSCCAASRAVRRAPIGGTIAAAATSAAVPTRVVLLVRATSSRTHGLRCRRPGG